MDTSDILVIIIASSLILMLLTGYLLGRYEERKIQRERLRDALHEERKALSRYLKSLSESLDSFDWRDPKGWLTACIIAIRSGLYRDKTTHSYGNGNNDQFPLEDLPKNSKHVNKDLIITNLQKKGLNTTSSEG